MRESICLRPVIRTLTSALLLLFGASLVDLRAESPIQILGLPSFNRLCEFTSKRYAQTIALSPDHRRVALLAQGWLQVYERMPTIPTAMLLCEREIGTEWQRVFFSGDSQTLLVVKDSGLQTFQAQSLEPGPLQPIPAVDRGEYALWSATSNRLVLMTADRGSVWELPGPKQVFTFTRHRSMPHRYDPLATELGGIILDSRGKHLLDLSFDRQHHAVLWDLDERCQLNETTLGACPQWAVAFQPQDPSQNASYKLDTVLMDLAQKIFRTSFTHTNARFFGERWAITQERKFSDFHLVDLETQQVFRLGGDSVADIQGDCLAILTNHTLPAPAWGGKIRIHSRKHGDITIPNAWGGCRGVGIDPGGRWAAVLGEDRVFYLWDLEQPFDQVANPVHSFRLDYPSPHFWIHPEGTFLAMKECGGLQLISTETGERVQTWPGYESATFHPTEPILYLSSAHEVAAWSLTKHAWLARYARNNVIQMSPSPDGKRLAILSGTPEQGPKMEILDTSSLACMWTLEQTPETRKVWDTHSALRLIWNTSSTHLAWLLGNTDSKVPVPRETYPDFFVLPEMVKEWENSPEGKAWKAKANVFERDAIPTWNLQTGRYEEHPIEEARKIFSSHVIQPEARREWKRDDQQEVWSADGQAGIIGSY